MKTDHQGAEDFPRRQISGFVLAGGRSTRLGRDKVLLPWNGRTLLQHAVERLQPVCGTVRVCANRSDLRDSSLLAEDACIADAVNHAGPLGGIVAALDQSHTDWNFFLAVDLPLVPSAFLRALAKHAVSAHLRDGTTLCVLPTVEGRPQPLCGMYHRHLAHGLRRALAEGKYKIMLALRDAVAETETRQASRLELLPVENFAANAAKESSLHPREWFLNVNTPEEWQLARRLAGAPLSDTPA